MLGIGNRPAGRESEGHDQMAPNTIKEPKWSSTVVSEHGQGP